MPERLCDRSLTLDLSIYHFGKEVLSLLAMNYPTIGDLRLAADQELLRCPFMGKVRLKALRAHIGMKEDY